MFKGLWVGDTTETEINKMPQEPLLFNAGLPEGQEGGHENEHQRIENITKGCPQGSCCGPGLWNVQQDNLLKLQYKKQTRVIAFAYDFLVLIRAECIDEVENNENIEIEKIENWVTNNMIKLNERIKSHVTDKKEM